MIAPVTPIPGTALVACANVAHRVAFKPKEGCPACRQQSSGGRPASGTTGAHRGEQRDGSRDDGHPARAGSTPAPRRPRGKQHEDALEAALVAAGFEVVTYAKWLARALEGGISPVFVREFPAGIMLSPPRRFRCDFLHPMSKTVVEIEGGAHGVQRQRKSDILREQLLESAGLRVVRVLPEQVTTGAAVALVKRAIGAKE